VQREYFDPKVASRVEVSLRERLAHGRYDTAPTLESLANMLTRDLFDLTQDKHLNVVVVQEAQSTASSAKTANLSREARGRRENFGVQRVEILAGNVGYLNLTAFYRPDEARDTLSAAMRTLQYADTIILDMRSNSGGSPETAALLLNYFFDAPRLPLFTIVGRSGESQKYFTEKTRLTERNESRPVYVLTSKQTFSAGEGTAFLLQERQRAEVVGETTAGAANPGKTYPVNSRFEVTIPSGKLEAAVTRKNWEGCGVKPDVAVPASDALRVAHARALRRLLGQSPNTNREELKRQLQTLAATKH
jgi:C-terminal processing protease CtpA/Prc